jgi:hypothetical protein
MELVSVAQVKKFRINARTNASPAGVCTLKLRPNASKGVPKTLRSIDAHNPNLANKESKRESNAHR